MLVLVGVLSPGARVPSGRRRAPRVASMFAVKSEYCSWHCSSSESNTARVAATPSRAHAFAMVRTRVRVAARRVLRGGKTRGVRGTRGATGERGGRAPRDGFALTFAV